MLGTHGRRILLGPTGSIVPAGPRILYGPTDPTEFPRPAAVLLDPGCPWMQGSHRIPLDPTRSLWVPLGSTRCCLSKSTVSLDPRIPPDPTGCQWIPMGATGFHGPCWVHMVVGSSWVLLDPRCSGLDRPNWISATCCWFAAPMVIRAPGSRACCNAFHNGSYDFLASALSFPNGSYDFTAAVMASHKGSYVFCELQTGSRCKTKADP